MIIICSHDIVGLGLEPFTDDPVLVAALRLWRPKEGDPLELFGQLVKAIEENQTGFLVCHNPDDGGMWWELTDVSPSESFFYAEFSTSGGGSPVDLACKLVTDIHLRPVLRTVPSVVQINAEDHRVVPVYAQG